MFLAALPNACIYEYSPDDYIHREAPLGLALMVLMGLQLSSKSVLAIDDLNPAVSAAAFAVEWFLSPRPMC